MPGGHGGGPKDDGVGGGGHGQHEGVGRGHSSRHDQVQRVLTNGQRQVRQNGQQHVSSGRVGCNLKLEKKYDICWQNIIIYYKTIGMLRLQLY